MQSTLAVIRAACTHHASLVTSALGTLFERLALAPNAGVLANASAVQVAQSVQAKPLSRRDWPTGGSYERGRVAATGVSCAATRRVSVM